MPAPRAAIFTRVAIYNRISNDPQGIEAGVEGQRQDCEALAGRLGWQVAKVYVDNDLSAWTGKRRPDYQQMLADIRAGKVDAVIVWHEDRLTRLPRELEEFADTCLKAGVHRLVSCYGDTDLSNSDDMLTLRIKGAVAKNQSDAASRRLRRKHLELAQGGRPNGGRRPYGYEGAVHDAHGAIINRDRAYKALVPAEATRIREAAERVLAGESVRSVAKEWNEQEVPTPHGGELWSQGNLKRILVSPRIAGLREHKGTTYPASWEAIISPEQHELLVTLLTDLRTGRWPGARQALGRRSGSEEAFGCQERAPGPWAQAASRSSRATNSEPHSRIRPIRCNVRGTVVPRSHWLTEDWRTPSACATAS
jgi:DNA invertase Pin-like site-specific DNA recombinase